MGIRTPDLLHAISRQPVHRSPSAQVSVLARAPECAIVRTRCGTFVLYALPAAASGSADDQHRREPLQPHGKAIARPYARSKGFRQ